MFIVTPNPTEENPTPAAVVIDTPVTAASLEAIKAEFPNATFVAVALEDGRKLLEAQAVGGAVAVELLEHEVHVAAYRVPNDPATKFLAVPGLDAAAIAEAYEKAIADAVKAEEAAKLEAAKAEAAKAEAPAPAPEATKAPVTETKAPAADPKAGKNNQRGGRGETPPAGDTDKAPSGDGTNPPA